LAESAHAAGKRLRPQAKAHKCPEIAKRQIAAGACGICVATTAEAELMAKAGIGGLLLTSPVADPLKIAGIVETDAMVAVDHVRQVKWYRDAAHEANRTVDVLVDLDVGDHGTGAIPGVRGEQSGRFEVRRITDGDRRMHEPVAQTEDG
ncbi:MAG: alanine racemase, partial [Acidobacteriota bacterium]|nr:alanine racemase [Acidobacteriota bacterium]